MYAFSGVRSEVSWNASWFQRERGTGRNVTWAL